MLAFEGSHRGESPAGAALRLVLDGSDDTLLAPIDGLGHGVQVDVSEGLGVLLGLGRVTETVAGGELGGGEISEVVDSAAEGLQAKVVQEIVLLDFQHGLGEDVSPGHLLGDVRVALAIQLLIGQEKGKVTNRLLKESHLLSKLCLTL